MPRATLQRWTRVATLLLAAVGARPALCSEVVWRPPGVVPSASAWSDTAGRSAAEATYAAAVRAHADGDPTCVDNYFRSAAHSWRDLEACLAAGRPAPPRATELYDSALAQLLITAQQFGRWDPCRGLTVDGVVVPARYSGFLWTPDAFAVLNPVGSYEDPVLLRQHRGTGLGLALVARRNTANPAPFTHARQVFSATVVLRTSADRSGYELRFYDPLRVSSTTVAGRRVAIDRDLSAPFAFIGLTDDRQWIDGFVRPNDGGPREGLYMIEPFQPGKIPVVLVHGLLSDPRTWVAMTNELRARPDLNDRFQWLAFDYATGGPFLESAARLRQQLAEFRRVYDPARRDAALSRTVLVGHSMGGLVSKLQVTESGQTLWDAAATAPLASVRTTPEVRRLLQAEFYFRPSPDVSRVVYIATPHLGSYWAKRPVGRLVSSMVRPSARRNAEFDQLVRDNPGLLRNGDVDRLPTSIDLLEPSSPLLQATAALPYNPAVALHSIIGEDRYDWSGEPTDGIVPAWSARLRGVATERVVDASHLQMNKVEPTVKEVENILRLHLAEHAGRLAAQRTPADWD